MSALRQSIPDSDAPRAGDEGRAAVPPTSLSVVQPETNRVGADDPVVGGDDGGGYGAGDPAFDFFRQDAIRQGFVGSAGFAEYLKQYGILSDSKQRRIKEREVTGLDLDRDVEPSVIQRYEVTDSEL